MAPCRVEGVVFLIRKHHLGHILLSMYMNTAELLLDACLQKRKERREKEKKKKQKKTKKRRWKKVKRKRRNNEKKKKR